MDCHKLKRWRINWHTAPTNCLKITLLKTVQSWRSNGDAKLRRTIIIQSKSKIKNNINKKIVKTSGIDGLSSDVINALSESEFDIMLHICQRIWSTKQWTDDWTRSVVTSLHKKVSTARWEHYKLIALLSYRGSYASYHLLKSFLQWQVPQEQAVLVRGTACTSEVQARVSTS